MSSFSRKASVLMLTCSSSLTIAKRASDMGWRPKTSEVDYQTSILEDFELVYESRNVSA